MTAKPADLAAEKAAKQKRLKQIMGVAAILLYFVIDFLPAPDGLSHEGKRILGYMIATIIFWVFEVLPIGMSSVCALLVLPLTGLTPMRAAMQSFAIPTIFFIMASFCFATGFIKTGLGYRLSLSLSTMFGNRSKFVLLAFMMSTAVISMVLADIPTAIIFASIAFPILELNKCIPGESRFGRAMMMGIPMAAAIGGVGTPAGSGLNVLSLDLLQKHGNVSVNFLQWSAVGVPFVIILTFINWLVLIWMVPPEIDKVEGLDDIVASKAKLGPITAAERKFCIIFGITFILWLTSPLTKISIQTIAVVMATVLFIPGIDVITWPEANKSIAWEVLMIVGSSSVLAATMQSHGAATWIANELLGHVGGFTMLALLFFVIAYGIFSHYILPVANATLAVSIPVIAELSVAMGINPAIMIVPLAYTASCVFLLPVDPIPLTTYKYNYWSMLDMMKPGFIVSVIWVFVLTGFMYVATMVGIF